MDDHDIAQLLKGWRPGDESALDGTAADAVGSEQTDLLLQAKVYRANGETGAAAAALAETSGHKASRPL